MCQKNIHSIQGPIFLTAIMYFQQSNKNNDVFTYSLQYKRLVNLAYKYITFNPSHIRHLTILYE
jgi:hypothetical protein